MFIRPIYLKTEKTDHSSKGTTGLGQKLKSQTLIFRYTFGLFNVLVYNQKSFDDNHLPNLLEDLKKANAKKKNTIQT